MPSADVPQALLVRKPMPLVGSECSAAAAYRGGGLKRGGRAEAGVEKMQKVEPNTKKKQKVPEKPEPREGRRGSSLRKKET